MSILYLTGAPGSGKTTLAKALAEQGFELIPELVDSFPKDKYPDPRSLDTALHIYEQNIKRDALIRAKQANTNLVIYRHPLECLLIAKAYLASPAEFAQLEQLYLNFDWCAGEIVYLAISDQLQDERVSRRNLQIVSVEMFREIYRAYKGYGKYLQADKVLDSARDLESLTSLLFQAFRLADNNHYL